MKYTKSVKKGQPPAVYASGCILSEQICKPGSVIIRSSIYAYRYRHAPATSGAAGQALCSHSGVAPDRVYSGGRFHTPSGELLPRLSTLTGRRANAEPAVYLCCTFPEVAFGGRYPLSLPCGARTFLMTGLSAWPRDRLFSSRAYCTGTMSRCQREVLAEPLVLVTGGAMWYDRRETIVSDAAENRRTLWHFI